MSEEAQTQTAENTPASGTTQSRAEATAIPTEVLEKLQADVIEKAIKAATDEAGKISTKALDDQAARVLEALGGKKSEVNYAGAVHQRFLDDPVGLLAAVSAHASQETRREIQEAERVRAERLRASNEVLGKRPDITTNAAAMKMLDTFYDSSDPKKSEKERISEAVKEYDLLMEKNGAASAEERINAASVSRASANGGSAVESKPKTFQQRQNEVTRSSQDRLVEEYKKKHGGMHPG